MMSRKNSLAEKARRREERAQSNTPPVVARSGVCPSCGRWKVLDLKRASLCGRCANAFETAMFLAALQGLEEGGDDAVQE